VPFEQYAEPRARGRALLVEHLGLEQGDVAALLQAATNVIGTDRTGRCVELVQLMRPTQRYQGLSALAALVVGTRELGADWWGQPHRHPVTRLHREGPVTPDQRLAALPPEDEPPGQSTILDLGNWIADDAAVAAWGPLVDEVDLNDPNAIDRIANLPSDAAVGQRLTAHFDSGGVVDAVVEERDAGVLGTRLVGKSRYSTPADVHWGWGVALPAPGPFPLPGDPESVYGAPVDPERAERLRTEAVAFGWSPDDVGAPWTTRGDVCAALARLDWPWLDGTGATQEWARATEELVDWP